MSQQAQVESQILMCTTHLAGSRVGCEMSLNDYLLAECKEDHLVLSTREVVQEEMSQIVAYSGPCRYCDCPRFAGDAMHCARASCGHHWNFHDL